MNEQENKKPNEILEKYLKQDLENPSYFFLGSPKLLEKVCKNTSHDSDNQKVNIDNAVFLTSSFTIASAYAFKDQIKENSKNLEWDFNILNSQQVPVMLMKNVKVRDDMYGYVYIFENTEDFYNEPQGSLQYKSYQDLIPVDVVKIQYVNFKQYYQVVK